ncbi:MAG: large rane protein [Frankiales bacterium]|nr:large rane protein [Frankiales bacterium]
MNGRSKVLAPLVTVVAVAAVAVTASVIAGRDGGPHSPRVLRLAAGATKSATPTASDYQLVGDLPPGKPTDAAAWNLPTGPGPEAAVARLAHGLRAGTPVRERGGWRAGGLGVSGAAGRAWYFSPCTGEGVGSPDGPLACATTGSGTVTAEPAPATPVPIPKQQTPTTQTVRAAAAPVLDAVGLTGAPARVAVVPGGGSLTVDPIVNGLETSSWTTRVDIDVNGRITSANGWLGTPAKADTYPLVTAREAFDALPPRPRILSCRVAPNGGCQQPVPEKISGGHLGLTVAPLADGGHVLLPAWLFDVKGAQDPVAGVAVEPRFLGTGDPPTVAPSNKQVPPSQVAPAPARTPLSFDSAYRAGTANAVVVQYGDSTSCPHQHVTHAVKESDTAVIVVLVADSRDPNLICTDNYSPVKLEIALKAPLGPRRVIDGTTGREIPVT